MLILVNQHLQVAAQLQVVSLQLCHCVTNVLLLLNSHSAACGCKVKDYVAVVNVYETIHLKHECGLLVKAAVMQNY